MDIIKPVWNINFTPSRQSSEIDNYMDMLQLTGMDSYVSSLPVDDVYEKFDNNDNRIREGNQVNKSPEQQSYSVKDLCSNIVKFFG